MRIAVELEAYGSTMDDIVADANKQWQAFTKNPEARLPHDTEISVQRHSSQDYRGTIFARVKVESND